MRDKITDTSLHLLRGTVRSERVETFAFVQVHLLLVSTVILYKFYHRMGAIFLMKDLSDPVEKADKQALAACPPGELCSYRFFHGMLFVRPPTAWQQNHD